MKLIRNKITIVPGRDLSSTTLVIDPPAAVLNVAREQDYGFWVTEHDPAPVAEYAKVPLHNDHNHAVEFMAAIHVLRGLCERHGRVIVTCQIAVNRSPAVVALWLAQQFTLSWQEAAEEVKAVRRHMNIHRGLLRTIAEILDRGPTEADIAKATL